MAVANTPAYYDLTKNIAAQNFVAPAASLNVHVSTGFGNFLALLRTK